MNVISADVRSSEFRNTKVNLAKLLRSTRVTSIESYASSKQYFFPFLCRHYIITLPKYNPENRDHENELRWDFTKHSRYRSVARRVSRANFSRARRVEQSNGKIESREERIKSWPAGRVYIYIYIYGPKEKSITSFY